MPRRKKTEKPLTVEEAQAIAREIAKKFDVFECDLYVLAIAKRLGRAVEATFERLRTADATDIIGLAEAAVPVSTNGVHVGIRIGDRIIDNMYPEGIPADEWAKRFVAGTDALLVHDSSPVSAFLGTGFATKEFYRWLNGALGAR